MSIRYDNYMGNQFSDFKRRVRKHTPSLATRVFALRGKCYWELEKNLGKVLIYTAADYWPENNQHHSGFIVIYVLVAGFFADLAKAEKSCIN